MSDSRFADVTALLPFDGANLSTTITDESDTGSTSWGFTGGGSIVTAQSKFGGASANVPSGNYIEYSDLSGTAYLFDPTDQFTFQTWVRPDSIGAAQSIFVSGGVWFGINASGELELDAKTSGGSTIASGSSTGTLSATTWDYIELSRDSSGDWRIFLDGTLEATISESAGDVEKVSGIQIGRKLGFIDLRPFAGHFDDLRITEGAPRNTSSYTAPTVAHPLFGGSGARIEVPSPLTAPSLLTEWELVTDAIIEVPSPLIGRTFSNPISPPEFLVTRKDFLGAYVEVPSPLTAMRSRVLNDFGQLIESPVVEFVMKVEGDPEIEIPIANWQATVQTDRQSFLQAVVPSGDLYVDGITARQGSNDFVIYRQTTIAGTKVQSEIARASLNTISRNGGAFRYTLTLRGYTSSFEAQGFGDTVTLQGVRTFSQATGGSVSVRCDIDYFLRPGQTVTGGGLTFEVSYINYFVPSIGDAYMDVGSRG